MEGHMKGSVSARKLSTAFAGCFLGAGYVSGREMWQFPGRFGPAGWVGLLLSISLLGGAGVLVLTLVRRTGRHELSFLMLPWQSPVLRLLLSLFSILLLFGVVTIMTAGTGAALRQAFGAPAWLCGLLFALLIAALARLGLRGMLSIFSCAVPVLMLCTVIFGAAALILLPDSPPPEYQEGIWWLPSAVAFTAYNMFSAVAILAPLGGETAPRVVPKGIALGWVTLLAVAAPILLALNRCAGAVGEEFPMLLVVTALSPALSVPYLCLLMIAMIITSFSCFLAGTERIPVVSGLCGWKKTAAFFCLAAVAWVGSLLGFGRIISLIYPVFGGVSAFFLTGMVIRFCMECCKQRETEKNQRDVQ